MRNKLIYIGLLVTLFISILLVGTPIKYNIMYVNLVANVITIAIIFIDIIYRKRKIEINKFDICVGIIVFSTFIPLIFGTYLRLADTVEYILRYITVFNMYMITKIAVKNNRKVINSIFDIIIFSSIILIIFGIDMMTQNIFKEFYNIIGIPKVLNESNYRMGSLFGYPNTLAIFLVVSSILSITRYINKKDKKYRKIYAITLFIQIFGLIMTYSRLSFFVLIVAIIMILVCIKDKKIRKQILKLILFSSINAGIYFLIFNKLLNARNYVSIYIILLVQSIIYYVMINYLENVEIKNRKNICITVSVIAIIFISILTYSLVFSDNGIVLFKYINNQAVYRKQNILVENNKEYVVEFNIESSSNIKDNFKIQCKEIDKNGEEIEIHEKRFDNYNGNITIKFTTSESAKTISIVFNNTNENSNGFLNVKQVKINGVEEKISYGVIPIELINRFIKIKVDADTFSGRLEYYKNSIELIKNNFFTGAGGYAWKNSGEQTKTRGIAEHSYPMQLFIQNGVISFITYIALIVIVIKNMKNDFKENKNIEKVGLYVIVIALALHSLFDFDMYFLNILIMFYVFIAMVSSEDNDILVSHRYSYLYVIIVIFALYFSVGEVITTSIGEKINDYNYMKLKIAMVPYDYTFRKDKVNYLSKIKNENIDKLDKEEEINISKEIIKEEEYIIGIEKNENYDDLNRLILNYIDVISNDNEDEILDKINTNFEKLDNNKKLVYQAMESRFKRKYFNENIEEFLNKIKEENGLSEESVNDNN